MSALVDLEGVPLPMRGSTHPHITIATNPFVEAKAEESNNFSMENYEAVEPIEICGTIEEIMK